MCKFRALSPDRGKDAHSIGKHIADTADGIDTNVEKVQMDVVDRECVSLLIQGSKY